MSQWNELQLAIARRRGDAQRRIPGWTELEAAAEKGRSVGHARIIADRSCKSHGPTVATDHVDPTADENLACAPFGRIFHARAGRMARMEQNPYQSPADDRPAIPAWRYVVCALLTVLGAVFCLALPADVIERLFYSGFNFYDATEAAFVSATSATGVGAIWLGFRILRRKTAARPRSQKSEIVSDFL
jgi:hypothetical protein